MSRPFARWAAGAMTAVLVATAASRLMTYIMKLLTDAAIAFGQGRAGVDEVWRWALLFPAVYLANEAVWRTSGFCGMRWITGVVAEVNRRLFSHLSEHSATYFADRYAGALVNKIANAANGTEQLLAQWLWQFFPWIIGLLADLNLTYLAHPYFALVLVAWMAVYVPTNVFFVSRLHRLASATQRPPRSCAGRWWTAPPTSTPCVPRARSSTRRATSASTSGCSRSRTCASGGGRSGCW